MLDTFLVTLSPMLVMFSCILVGYFLKKARLIPDNTAAVLSKLEVYALLPANILRTFLSYCTVDSIRSRLPVLLYSCAAITLSVLLGVLLYRFFSKDRFERSIYRYSLIIANNGFLGTAVVPQILGDALLYDYMLFIMPIQIVIYGWAMNSLKPEKTEHKEALWKRFMNPTMLAMLAGILLGVTGLGSRMPTFVNTAVQNLGNCMGPIAMVLTGVTVAGYSLKELLKNKRVYAVSFLRLVVLPLIIVGAVLLLGADKQIALLTMFAYGSALGLNTVVIPAAYGGDTRPGAAMALISHAGAVLTIPLLYALLTQLL